MKFLLSKFLNKPVALLMFFVFASGLGILGAQRTHVALMPEMTYPGVSVRVNFPGESAERVETEVAIPVEEKLNTISKVKSINTNAAENQAEINISFELGTDMERKFLEIREQMKRVEGDLPRGVRRVQVKKYRSQDMPVLITAFTSSDLTPEQIRRKLKDALESDLQRLDGTADVRLVGGREEKLIADVEPHRMKAFDLSLSKLSMALSRATATKPLDDVVEGGWRTSVRQTQIPADPERLADLPVSASEDGLVSLGAVADVRRGFLPDQKISRVNGMPSVAIYLFKTSDANLLELTRRARELIESTELEKIHKHFVFDQSDPVQRSFDSLRRSVLLGGLAAVVVLSLFLRKKEPVIIVSLVIPISVLIILFLVYLSPYTLNVITLGGIAMGIGMLVDSAIVVLENIRRVRNEGAELMNASVIGTAQVVPGLIAAVLTTVIVFLPLLFLNPQIQQMYIGFAFTVSAGLVSSLLVSTLLVPVLSMWLTDESETKDEYFQPYQDVLKFFLRNKGWTVIVLIIIMASSGAAYSQLGESLGTSFASRNLTLNVELDPGTPLYQTRREIEAVEDILEGKPYIENYTTRMENWTGKVNIQLVSLSVHPIRAEGARNDIKKSLKDFEERGLQLYFQEGDRAAGQRITLDLAGPEIPRLQRLAKEYRSRLAEIPELTEVRMVMPRPRPAFIAQFSWDKLAQYNLTLKSVLEELRTGVGGSIATRIRDEGTEFETIIRLPEEELGQLDDLRFYTIKVPGENNRVWLSQLAEFTPKVIEGKIQRKDGRRTAFIQGKAQTDDLGGLFDDIHSAVQELPLPEGYYFDFGDSYEKLVEMRQGMTWVIIITVTLIYLVLMGVLESLWEPLLIMLSVPAAISGSLWSLYLADVVLSLPVYIGLIMLMGMVVNSSIVLVIRMSDHFDKTDDPFEAAVLGASERFKPILMTNSTTVIAIFPLLFSQASGAALSYPLALTVITGLVGGVLFNLLVLPGIFYGVEQIKAGIFRRVRRLARQ